MPKKHVWSQRGEDQEINKAIIDLFISLKKCTLLTNCKWDCSKCEGYKLRKGKEKWCNCPDFINCPAFNQYLNYLIALKAKRKGSEKKR